MLDDDLGHVVEVSLGGIDFFAGIGPTIDPDHPGLDRGIAIVRRERERVDPRHDPGD
ncbi:MAG: hypothetical protein N2038_02610 [Geminicoccaceae bacterium]|nr:hypothetical protein [Geminicoccaceae bacterium]MCX7629121.1 hypothetical protein [Geminicoccaceae bacterium]MDW8124867.1 hypothetical protein [Geminicoccaceae bacterium]